MPERPLSPEELKGLLANPVDLESKAFQVMRSLTDLASERAFDDEVQDLVLRALEHRDRLGWSKQVLDGLVREIGLFPFLDPESLGFADRIAYEFHRPDALGESGFVFHRPQARVFRELVDGRSVILSAPTSFGKSLIIDAILATEKYRNVLIVVPTIALIDETRRRLAQLSTRYKLITHPSQSPAEYNAYVLTQERALDLANLEEMDFFVIDEFYKLAPGRDGEERASLLNQVFYRLAKAGKPFYLLGPSVTGVTDALTGRIECTLIVEHYHTVVSELHRVPHTADDLQALADLCAGLKGPTIVFCQSPRRAAEVARFLINKGVRKPVSELNAAVGWLSRNYHPEWHFTRALANGIGVHHGRIPRALAQFVVRSFDSDRLSLLVCTSTLIEGVNTKAQNMVIFDNKINRQKYDYFTFNNIRGRSGRMFQHFIGHVYLFHDPPQDVLPFVDIPAFSQGDDAPESLLIQLHESDLTESSRWRVHELYEQRELSLATIRANVGIDPDSQVGLARELASNIRRYHSVLRWQSFPSAHQVAAVCELMWNHFDGPSLGAGSIRSARQLAFRINSLRRAPSTRELIEEQLRFDPDPEKAVPAVLDFLRLWAGFHFPRLLRAIDRIQAEVFVAAGLAPGNCSPFATMVENLFLDPAIVALDEFGIPIEIARRLEGALQPEGDVDRAILRLASLDLRSLDLDVFERSIVRDAQQALQVPLSPPQDLTT